MILFVLLCFATLGQGADDQDSQWKLHPSCMGSENAWTCSKSEISLPDNFDVARFSPDIKSIVLGTGLVKANFIPFPDRPSLRDVHFMALRSEGRFPFAGLLGSNKKYLEGLTLDRTDLFTLNAAEFAGFNKLKRLVITDCKISSVNPAVFENLGLSDAGNVEPQLEDVTIDEEKQLVALDWSFLKPVAKKLKKIVISKTNIVPENLTLTTPFLLEKAEDITIEHSKLDYLPEAIFKTINPKAGPNIELWGNPLCQREEGKIRNDCDCCEMYPFAKWLKENNLKMEQSLFTCDVMYPPAELSYYKHCDPETQKMTPNCSYFEKSFHCGGNDAFLLIPENFDLDHFDSTLIPSDVESVTLRRGSLGSRPAPQPSVSIPPRANLTSITIRDFNLQKNDVRFPFGSFFAGVLTTVESITLYNVKLLFLENQDFVGFLKLKSLAFDQCQLKTIHPDTFLGFATFAPNTLEDFSVTNSPNLEEVDWSFLKPVSGSVKSVQLSNNGLSKVSKSSPFVLEATTTINVQKNRFLAVPVEITETISSNLTVKLNVGGAFCHAWRRPCTCLEMLPFATWLHARPPATINLEPIGCWRDFKTAIPDLASFKLPANATIDILRS